MKKIFLLSAIVVIATSMNAEAPANVKYVDLGLSVKWATINVGATAPEQYGSYFAWGETQGEPYNPAKDDGSEYVENYSEYSFDWDNYKYGDGNDEEEYELTKYCSNSDYGKDGYTDELTVLESMDDAATVNWGSDWRMPTRKELEEIRENCVWVGTDDYQNTGVAGEIVYKKKEGEATYDPTIDSHIFFPAAGYRHKFRLAHAGMEGDYWGASLEPFGFTPCDAEFLGFSPISLVGGVRTRQIGMPIRPVYCGSNSALPSIKTDARTLKHIQNGRFVIEKNNFRYNALGQKLQ